MNERIVRISNPEFPAFIKQTHVFFAKNKGLKPRVLSFIFLLLCILLLTNSKAKAQDDSTEYSDEEYSTDTASKEESYDTTSYYFNWKENKSDVYTTQKIGVRVSSDTTIQRLKGEDDFWYVKSIQDFKNNAYRLKTDPGYRDSLKKAGLLPPDEQVFTQEPESNDWYMQKWVGYLIWTIIIGIFVAAIVYFLASNRINIFSRSSLKTTDSDAGEDKDLFSINYDQLLAKYTAEKNYRLAVRVLYLQLLKMLTEKQLITYQPQFTDTNYLQQLSQSGLYKDFFTVTRHYEYIWYGEFNVTENAFQVVKNDFSNMKNTVLKR